MYAAAALTCTLGNSTPRPTPCTVSLPCVRTDRKNVLCLRIESTDHSLGLITVLEVLHHLATVGFLVVELVAADDAVLFVFVGSTPLYANGSRVDRFDTHSSGFTRYCNNSEIQTVAYWV